MTLSLPQENDITFNACNILVVDDDVIFNEIVSYFLELKQVNSIPAFTIAEALEKFNSSKVDFIILDGNLPDGNGIDFLKKLQPSQLTMPVMMITAEDNQDTMKNYFQFGIDDYLIKPVNIELMWLKIQRLYAAHVIQERERIQHEKLHALIEQNEIEENLARHVYKHLAGAKQNYEHIIKTSMQSSRSFNGDFFIARQGPSGNTFLTLLDATGHGLAAAISVLPQVAIFRAMIDKGFSLAHILHELNKKLNIEMPMDRFIAGILIEIDHTLNEIHIWNGAMPDVLIIDKNFHLKQAVPSAHMALGIMDVDQFDASCQTFSLDGGEQLIMFSDGLTEQASPTGEFFTLEKILLAVKQSNNEDSLFDDLLNAFTKHVDGKSLNDDVSLCCIDLDKLHQHLADQKKIRCLDEIKQGVLDVNIKVTGDIIGKVDLLEHLNVVMKKSNIAISLREKAFAVFSELINNAIDHGVLKLDSALKNEHERFIEYLELRDERLQKLLISDKVELHFKFNQATQQIDFEITDSGVGYNPEDVSEFDADSLSGRGLAMIKRLTQRVECKPPGNNTSVIIK